MKYILTEKKETGFKLLSFQSKSTLEAEIINDIIYVLRKIHNEQLINENQLLFYIDATNGSLFISGYNHNTLKVFDNNTIAIDFPEYWEAVNNAGEFDETIIDSINQAFKSDIGKTTRNNYTVYYQTETDVAEPLN